MKQYDARAIVVTMSEWLSLPVLRTCGDCAWCGPTSGGWSCDHPTSVDRMHREEPDLSDCPQGPHVDHDAAPPAWCPMREGAR